MSFGTHRPAAFSLRAALFGALVAAVAACSGPQVAEPAPVDPSNALAHASDYVRWAANGAERDAELTDEELALRLDLARALIDESEYESARRHLEILVDARPTWWSNHLAYATVLYFGASDAHGARTHVDECLRLDSRISGCHELAGMLAQDDGDYDEALAAFMRAVELTDGDPGIFERIARLHMRLQQYDEAREWAARVLDDEPRDVSVRLLVATIEERSGDLERPKNSSAGSRIITVTPCSARRISCGFWNG